MHIKINNKINKNKKRDKIWEKVGTHLIKYQNVSFNLVTIACYTTIWLSQI